MTLVFTHSKYQTNNCKHKYDVYWSNSALKLNDGIDLLAILTFRMLQMHYYLLYFYTTFRIRSNFIIIHLIFSLMGDVWAIGITFWPTTFPIPFSHYHPRHTHNNKHTYTRTYSTHIFRLCEIDAEGLSFPSSHACVSGYAQYTRYVKHTFLFSPFYFPFHIPFSI